MNYDTEGFDEEEESIDAITLAHYTVQEYLYSSRIAASPVSYFAMSQKIVSNEVLQRALNPPAQVDENFLTISYNENFERYCYEIARIALPTWESYIVQDENLSKLHQDLGSNPLFFHWIDILDRYDYLTDNASCLDIIFRCEKPQSEISRQAQYIHALSNFESWILVAKILVEIDIHDLLAAPLELQKSNCGSVRACTGKIYACSTILDALGAKSGHFNCSPFYGFLEVLRKHVLPNHAILFLLAAHYHESTCLDAGEDCTVLHSLQSGADVNALGLATMPLQIAVHRWDLVGTRFLLEAGADPNGIGQPEGYTPTHIDTTWASSSPLHILRNAEYGFMNLEASLGLHAQREKERAKIEQLLISYGAKDFN